MDEKKNRSESRPANEDSTVNEFAVQFAKWFDSGAERNSKIERMEKSLSLDEPPKSSDSDKK
jgi:hypothetical protein